MDHDQRFKAIIREFFVEFLTLFYYRWATRLDLSTIEWLDKELVHDPPDGTSHELDLVARVPFAEMEAATAGESLLLSVRISKASTLVELVLADPETANGSTL